MNTAPKWLTGSEALDVLKAGGQFRYDGDKFYIVGRPEWVQAAVVDRLILGGLAAWRGPVVTIKGEIKDATHQ